MAAIPKATESIRDPGLPIAGNISMAVAIIGESSLGDDNAVKQYSQTGTLVDERGQGPGVELAAQILDTIGGPVVFVKAATSVAASNSSVTKVGTGPDVTLSGDAVLDAGLRIVITTGGALGTAKFKYTLDNYSGATDSERTYSEILTVPSGGTFAIPTIGVTATFASGTYVAGETYSATLSCAASNATNLGAAMDALAASGFSWRFVAVATSNNTGDSAAHATLLATLQSKLTTLAAASKYRAGMIAANVTGADPTSAFSSVVAGRCLVAHGTARMVSTKPFIGWSTPIMPAVTCFAMRAAGCLPSTDLKRVKGDGIRNGGPLPNVLKIFQDEEKTPTALDDIKVSTLRTHEGRDGFYITQGRIKSADGSDFTVWPRRILMDIAMEVAHRITVGFIGQGLRTNGSGIENVVAGSIDERDAVRLEQEVNGALSSALLDPQNAEGTTGHVSDVFYSISRTNNILQTETIAGSVGIRPLGYGSYITTEFGFRIDTGRTA